MMKDRKTSPLSAHNETMGVMKEPKAPGEMHMGGVHKGGMEANMDQAVKHLSRQTERGEHKPTVSGHKMMY